MIATEPGPLRDATEEVLGRSEFDYSPGWLERVIERLLEWLSKLVPDVPIAGTGRFGGGIGWALFVLFCAVVVLALAWLIRYVVVHRVLARTRPNAGDAVDVHLDRARPAQRWDAEAEAAERDGRWKDALRARYAALVRRLTDRRLLPDVPGCTTGELHAELSGAAPQAAADFGAATRLFEDAWYGGRLVAAEHVAELRRRADAVLAVATEPASADTVEASR